MARILVLCSRTPYPLTGGAKLRLFNTAKILATEHTVDLLIVDESPVKQYRIDTLSRVFNDVTIFSYPSHRFHLNTMLGLVSRKPLQTFYYSFNAIDEWLDNHVGRYDLLYCNHVRTTEYARRYETPRVVDFVDAISRNYAESSTGASGLWRVIYPIESSRLLRYEREVVRDFDHSFIITEADKQYIEGDNAGLPSFSVVPNGVRNEILEQTPSEASDQDNNPGNRELLVFLGKMDYFPNEDAVTYFVKEIFPLVRRHHPEAEFVIVGTQPTKKVRQLAERPGVRVTGFVEDPFEYLTKARVVVAPMRFSAGLQNKVLESMGLGKAVVTTSLGAEGIDIEEDEHLKIADTPESFAEVIRTLLVRDELRERLGTQARQRIEETYSWSEIEPLLLDPIDAVLNQQ